MRMTTVKIKRRFEINRRGFFCFLKQFFPTWRNEMLVQIFGASYSIYKC